MQATQHTLVQVLEETLGLLHPIIPFITEAIWQEVGKQYNEQPSSISIATYPQPRSDLPAFNDQASMQWLIDTITAIRTMRSEMQISPAKTIDVILQSPNEKDNHYHQQHQNLLTALSKADYQWLSTDTTLPPAASQVQAQMTISIPLAGLIQKDEEISRVEKQIQKISKMLTRGQQQLANPRYVNNAPQALVDEVKAQVQQWEHDIKRYEHHLQVLASMTE